MRALKIGEYLSGLTDGELRIRWGSLYRIVVDRGMGIPTDYLMLDATERELVERGFRYDLEYSCWAR